MTTATTSITKSITVDAPPERAFEVFTDGFATWWPLDSHHIGEKDAVTVVIEPRAGGRWFERAGDGSECEWGRVIAYEPPHRLVLGWQLDADYDYDPELLTEVEVRFHAEASGGTRVTLEHRDLDRFGERAAEVREAFGSENGWAGLLGMFAAAVQ